VDLLRNDHLGGIRRPVQSRKENDVHVEENTVCMMTIVGVGTDGVGCLMFARAATALGLREFSGDEWRKPMPVPFGRGGASTVRDSWKRDGAKTSWLMLVLKRKPK